MEQSRELLPLVLFLNKTDLANIIGEEELRSNLRIPTSVPIFKGIAREGYNVIETFQWLFQTAMKANVA
jgi:signal recognition particle receptor subunit beta